MKHAVALFVALFSMIFLMGDSCDSGDFTTNYFCCGTAASCTTTATQCAPSDCSTGLQTFQNGQNECAILQTDASNNNCALFNRFGWFITIGCSGSFTETPPFAQVPSLTATPGPGAGVITLNWTTPPGGFTSSQLVYTILLGTVAGGESFLAGGIVGNSFPVTGLTTGTPYFFTVAASLIFAGNIASAGVASPEATAISP
jgi:hypothetical protein